MSHRPSHPPKLVVRRTIPASREAVFAAWTDPQGMRDWMCPEGVEASEAELDVRVGGSFRIVMRGGGNEHEHTGVYQLVEPPSKLAFTWISKGTGLQPTLVTIELFERAGKCDLVLTHEGLPTGKAVDHHKGGWRIIVGRLSDYLRNRRSSEGRR